MDEKIDKLIDLCGTKNKYQYILLFIAFICWINNMMVSIALPFLEKTPEVTFIDPITKEIKKEHLNYTICTWNKSKYNISENYDYSWVIYFNVSCDQIKTGLIGSFNFAGSFLGSISLNFFADNFGRKYSIIFSFLLYIIFNTLIVFMTNYYLVIAINFLLNTLNTYINYILLMMVEEITYSKYRGTFGTIINSGFPACALVYFPLFIWLKTWQKVFIVNSIIALIMYILFHIFSFESPRYYFFKGEINEGIQTLQKISKFHNLENEFLLKINSEEYRLIIDELIDNAKNKRKKDYSKTDLSESMILIENEKEEIGVLSLFIYPSLRYKFLILCYLGFCISGSYNGVSITIKNLPGDIFTNGMLFYSFEVFVGILSGWIINTKLGRKGTIISLYFISFVSFSIFLFYDIKSVVGQIINILFLKFSISAIFSVIYTFFLENYPTCIRAIGFGINTSFDNIGGTVFPIIVEILTQKQLFSLMAILNITEFVLMFFMDETNGIALPETIKEIEEKEKKIKERENYHIQRDDINFNNILDDDLIKETNGNNDSEKINDDIKNNLDNDNKNEKENENEDKT